MLLKKASPFKVQPPTDQQVKGIYMTREKRLEAKNEISRAHFHFGSNEVSKSILNFYITSKIEFPQKSFSHSHYSNVEVKPNKT